MKIQNISRPVIVPWDFSDLARKTLEQVLEMTDSRDRLRVVHVTASPTAFEYGVVWDSVTDDEIRSRVEQEFRKTVKGDSRLDGIHFVTLFGDPGSRICEYAGEEKAELIVMPSHGRTGFSHFLLGSVAERVVRLAPCPVLVMRETPAK